MHKREMEKVTRVNVLIQIRIQRETHNEASPVTWGFVGQEQVSKGEPCWIAGAKVVVEIMLALYYEDIQVMFSG